MWKSLQVCGLQTQVWERMSREHHSQHFMLSCFSNDKKSAPWYNHMVHRLHRLAAVSRFCACIRHLYLKDMLWSDGQLENKGFFFCVEEHMLLTELKHCDELVTKCWNYTGRMGTGRVHYGKFVPSSVSLASFLVRYLRTLYFWSALIYDILSILQVSLCPDFLLSVYLQQFPLELSSNFTATAHGNQSCSEKHLSKKLKYHQRTFWYNFLCITQSESKKL